MGESWQIKNNLELERMRYLSAICKNAGLVARGGKITKLESPEDLFELPQDRERQEHVKPKSDVNSFERFFRKAQASGVKFSKTPDFEYLRNKHK